MKEWYPRFGSGEMGLHDLFFLVFLQLSNMGVLWDRYLLPSTLQVTINMMGPKPDWRRMLTV